MSDQDKLMDIKNLYWVNGVTALSDALSVIDAVINESECEHAIKMLKESRANLVYFKDKMSGLL